MTPDRAGVSRPRKSAWTGKAAAITYGLLIIGNGPVLPIFAYLLRHATMTPGSWRAWLVASLVVGAALPLAIVLAFTIVALLQKNDPRTMLVFGLLWTAPGLIACHNAVSDLMSGPVTTEEHVKNTTRSTEELGGYGGGVSSTYHLCTLHFADGKTHALDRYETKYTTRDPCHGIKAGDTIRMSTLAHVEENVSVDVARGAG